MEKFTPLAKNYTAAGSDASDKSHLWFIVTVQLGSPRQTSESEVR